MTVSAANDTRSIRERIGTCRNRLSSLANRRVRRNSRDHVSLRFRKKIVTKRKLKMHHGLHRDEEGNVAIRMRLVEIPYALQRTGYAVPLLRAHRTTRKRERRRVCEHDTRISSSDFSFFHLATARPEVRSASLLPDVALFYSFLLVGDTRIACLRATRPTSKLCRVSQNFNIALVKIAVVFCRNRYVCVYVCVHTLAVALGRTRVLAMPLPIARSICAMLSDRRDVFQYFHRVLREILVFAVTISRVRRAQLEGEGRKVSLTAKGLVRR